MSRNPGKIPLLAVATAALLSWSAAARAGTLYSQPYNGFSPGVPSQVFTDTAPPYDAWSTKAFDDFTVTGTGWLVQGATIYGQDQGDATQNLAINLQFQSTSLPDYNNTAGIMTGGTETGGNLNFTGLDVFLAPGTYWITSWVVRPELPTGGQWFWYMTDAGSPIGSEFYIQNPGGGLIPGASSAVPGSSVLGTLPSDLAFTIYGQTAVPEPSSVVLLAIGSLALAVFARRSRVTAS
jgi:hypothetical protein